MSIYTNCTIYYSLLLLILFTSACSVDGGETNTGEGRYNLSSSANPESISPPQFVAPDSTELTSVSGEDATQDEIYERDIANRIVIADDSLTASIVVGDVISVKSILFEDEQNITPTGEARGPRFLIFTRVKIDVHVSYKQSMLGKLTFWYRGGVLDEEDHVDGKPSGEYLSGGARVEVGDRIIACIQINKSLPNSENVLRLRGHRWGITYMDNDNDYDSNLSRELNDHLRNSYVTFGQK